MSLVRRIDPPSPSGTTSTWTSSTWLVVTTAWHDAMPRSRACDHLPAFLSGVETGWSNHTFPGTTSFVVELPAGPVSPIALARHLQAVRAMELASARAHRRAATP